MLNNHVKPNYAVNFSLMPSAGRTSEILYFSRYKDARQFALDHLSWSGYILKITNPPCNTFKVFFGGFVPSAQEGSVLDSIAPDWRFTS